MCQEVVTAGKEINAAVKRVRRRMPQDGSVGPLSYPQDVQDTLTAAINYMNNAARAMRHLTRNLLQQTSLLAGVSLFCVGLHIYIYIFIYVPGCFPLKESQDKALQGS